MPIDYSKLKCPKCGNTEYFLEEWNAVVYQRVRNVGNPEGDYDAYDSDDVHPVGTVAVYCNNPDTDCHAEGVKVWEKPA